MSDRGYWEQDQNGIIQQRKFQNPFPGTMVNVEINTADKKSYYLKSELAEEDIF